MAGADTSEFSVKKTLGEGAFGKVYLVTDKNDTSKEYAMKVIDLTRSPPEERNLALSEARLLSDLNHENILHYVTSFEENGALCIVTEYCDAGDLSEYLEDRKGKLLSEDRVVMWFKEICSALEYLHERKTLHRDLKTQNVFLTGPKKSAKLGDLGLAKVLERPNAKAVTFCGSPYYMSPELFACKPYDNKSDVWSLGVVVYEIATLDRPFDATMMQQLVFKIVNGQLPPMPDKHYSAGLVKLMTQMLDKSTDTRPSAKELLQNSLFQQFKTPKTPPPVPKRMSSQVEERRQAGKFLKATVMGKGDNVKVFDMTSLMSTLTQNYKDIKHGKAAASSDDFGGIGTILLGAKPVENKFLKTNYEESECDKFAKTTMKNVSKYEKTISPQKPTPRQPPNQSKVPNAWGDPDSQTFLDKGDAEKTIAAGYTPAAQNPTQMMQMVVHTLTHIFPKGAQGEKNEGGFASFPEDSQAMEPEAMLLHQIMQLQQHCARVIGDEAKFRRAYDMLDQEDDEMQLEAKLIKYLSIEVFGACGVQLFYCKTFEYNLEKLQDGGRGTTSA